MTLLERVRDNRCTYVHVNPDGTAQGCEEPRLPDTALCRDHAPLLWRNQLERREDGRFETRRAFLPRELTGWAA